MPILRGNRKTAKSEYELRLVCMTVCLSVRMKQLGPQWTNFEEIWHLNISRKSIEKIQDLLPGEAVGWGTALQTRSSRVWFPMLSMEFFIDINLWHWGRLSLIEMSTRDISLGVGWKAAGAYDWQSYHLHVPTVLKSGSLKFLEPSGPFQACTGTVFPAYRFYE